MTFINWLLLALLSLIWGGTFLFAKIAVAEIPPLVLVFLRVFLAALVMHAVLGIARQRFPLAPGMLLSFLVIGLTNNAIPFSLLFWGQTAISASLASILNATTPIFTVLVATLAFRHETLQAHRLIGIGLGLAGVAVLLLPGLEGAGLEGARLDGPDGVEAFPLWAQLACLGAALSYAVAASFARRFKGLPLMVPVVGQLTGASVWMLPLALWQGASWSPAETSLAVWACVIALGTIGTAFAYLIYFRLLTGAGATNASLVTLLVPVSASVLGALVLGESLNAGQFLGMAILLVGLVVLDGRVLTLLPRWRLRRG